MANKKLSKYSYLKTTKEDNDLSENNSSGSLARFQKEFNESYSDYIEKFELQYLEKQQEQYLKKFDDEMKQINKKLEILHKTEETKFNNSFADLEHIFFNPFHNTEKKKDESQKHDLKYDNDEFQTVITSYDDEYDDLTKEAEELINPKKSNNVQKNEKTITFNDIFNALKKKFSSFSSLGNIFSFQIFNQETINLKKTVHSLIENGLLDKVLEMQQQGYKLSSNMEKMLHQKMLEAIEQNPLPLFEKIMNKKLFIKNEYVIHFLFSKHSDYYLPMAFKEAQNNPDIAYKYDHIKEINLPYLNLQISSLEKKYPEFTKYVTSLFKDQSFRRNIFTQWKTSLTWFSNTSPLTFLDRKIGPSPITQFHKNAFLQPADNISTMSILFAEATMDEYLQCMKTINDLITKYNRFEEKASSKVKTELLMRFGWVENNTKVYHRILENMNSNFDYFYDKNLQIIGKQIVKPIETDPVILANHQINNILNGANLSSLPKEAQNLITSIQSSYGNVKNNMDYLDENTQHNIELMMTKRMVEIVHKYCHIDAQYRDTMIHSDNKTAKNLMIESLSNINEIFNHIVETINSAKLSSLSATQRYTNEIKKTYVSSDNIETNISFDKIQEDTKPEAEQETEEKEMEIGSSANSKKFKI